MSQSAAAPRWLFAAGGRYAREASPGFQPEVEIEITAAATEAPVLPGKPTKVWKYGGGFNWFLITHKPQPV